MRKGTSRARVAISLMAFSGLRLESLCNYEGNDGLRLGDIKELHIVDEITFDRIPAMILIKQKLSKPRNQYFTFIGKVGIEYINNYMMRKVRMARN